MSGKSALSIVLTTNFSPWSRYSGGGQRSTHQLAVALARRQHRIVVVYTKSRREKVVPPEVPYEIRWARFVGLRGSRDSPLRPFNAITVASVVRAILDEPGDWVVHGQGEEAALIPELRDERRFRFVMTPRYPRYPALLRGPRPPASLGKLWLAFTGSKYLLLGRALRHAELCCPTSKSSADLVRRAFGLAETLIHVVPNGVDDVFLETQRHPEAPSGPVMFFGRLSPSKGVDILIEALALLGERAPECVIVGRGPSESFLRWRARRLGRRVRFEPWTSPEELARKLARSCMAVLPSREESFGNTMAESMAAGAPVITTSVGSLPELIEHGRTGLLVPPGSARRLAEAIEELHSDSLAAERLGSSARAHVRERYSWDTTARAFEMLYQSINTEKARR